MTILNYTKQILKRVLPDRVFWNVQAIRRSAVGNVFPEVPFDNTYAWLNYAFSKIAREEAYATHPYYQYIWGTLQCAALARVLGLKKVSVVEFGVAGGAGLMSLEVIARSVELLTQIEIDVFGFDTGLGLPKPQDIRDQPNMWFEGQLPMDREALEDALTKAKLILGPVKETLPSFIFSNPAPIGFVSFDMDLYRSTIDALGLFRADYGCLLPRISIYFDDILGYTYNEFCGERLAINEFNASNKQTKICPIHGLRYFLPHWSFQELWPDGMYMCHFFEHPMYARQDSIRVPLIMDIKGGVTWR